MIKHWYLTGDIHGQIPVENWRIAVDTPYDESAIIILGDAGFNYYLNKKDNKVKDKVAEEFPGLTIYCVHGNHEERPEKLENISSVYDEDTHNHIWVEEDYPNIRYFHMWGEYKIAGYTTFVMGGAFSVDKEYRLLNHWQWFPTEQMTFNEKLDMLHYVDKKHFDLILSHTCPYTWQPFDLFLPFIDQSKVDNGMEHLFEDVLQNTFFDKWCYGHFHDDRWQNNRARMFYTDCVKIESIMDK